MKQRNMEHFLKQQQNKEAAVDFMLPDKGFQENSYFGLAKQQNKQNG